MVHCVIAPGMPRSLIETLHLLSKGTRMESIPAVKTWKRRKRYSCGRWCLPCRLTIWPRLLNLVKNRIPRISLSHDRGLLSSLPRILNASISQITSFKNRTSSISGFAKIWMFFITVQPQRVADSSVFSSAFWSTLAHPELSWRKAVKLWEADL